MKYITEEVIDRASKEIVELQEDQVQEFVNKFSKDQPYAFTYLLASGNEVLNDAEIEFLFLIGFIVWHSVKLANANLPEIDEDTVEKIEDRNIKMLEYFADNTEKEFIDEVEVLINNHKQKNLLKFAVTSVMDESKDAESEITDENIGIFFLALKTLIECFDEVDNML